MRHVAAACRGGATAHSYVIVLGPLRAFKRASMSYIGKDGEREGESEECGRRQLR